jgi:ribosomal protein L32
LHAPTGLEDGTDYDATKRHSSSSYQEQDYYHHSSLESTLERVLEMAQLGKEESIEWNKVVRSAYKAEYHEEEGSVCYLCGSHKSAHTICRSCANVSPSNGSGATTFAVHKSDSFTQQPRSYAV